MERKVDNISITRLDNHYMVCNEGVYFKIGMLEGKILEALIRGQSKESIIQSQNIGENDFERLVTLFKENGIIGNAKKEKINPLYIKIPLFDANKLLGRMTDWLKLHNVFRRALFLSFIFVIIFGVGNLVVNFSDIFTVRSLKMPIKQYALAYLLYMLIIVCHEFGHGFTCKYFGSKVGKIGLALIVFNPAMYCDISGIRMFRERKKQVLSSMAGFGVNALFVGIFSIMYCIWQTNFLRVMIVLNATSILINAIPFIRLDGYWVLSFAMGIQNLYRKSIIKLRNIRRAEFAGWRDYFILGYGVLNSIAVCYCCISFGIAVLGLGIKFLGKLV